MKLSQLTLSSIRLSMVLMFATNLSLISINPAIAQEAQLRTLTVTGQGIKKIPTTITSVQLGVEVQDKTAAQVQLSCAKRTSAVVDFLRSRKVDQLQTTGIRLEPNYQYNNNERRLLGYIGTNTVSFRLTTEQVGAVLDGAVNSGATTINGLSFTATDDAIAMAQKEALRLATLDAQQQSDAVLKALNLVPKQIVNIQINGASIVPSPRPFVAAQLSRTAANVTTPVIGGEENVQASVTLQISY